MSRKILAVSIMALALLWLAGPTLAADPGKGNILIEEWFTATKGNAITDNCDTLHTYINAGNAPDRGYWIKALDRPDGGEDYWGGRMRGYLYPPQTGDYTFWTVSDDDSEVWLSSDDTPANLKMICNVEGWANYQDWTYTSGSPGTTYKSKAIKLEAGKKYYIEVYNSDGTGGGCVSVGWGGPGIGAGPVLVDGKYLAPVIRNPEPMFMASNPNPADGTVGVTMPLLQWTRGATAMWDDVYFGTDPNPPLVSPRQLWNVYYSTVTLEPGQTYYWRVDEIEVDGTTIHQGPVWKFQSEPIKNYLPAPADGATGIVPGVVLTWKAGKDAAKYAMYFGTDMAAVTAGDAAVGQGTVAEAKFNTGALRASTTYYWRADVVKADASVVAGDVWSFTTSDAGPANKIKYEQWTNITGTAITDLTNNARYPGSPDAVVYWDSWQSPVDTADNYGDRAYGWLKPEQTGDYTFWIAGDDSCELLLSTDGSPTNAVMVANVPGWTPALDFDNTGGGTGGASQKSAPIKLEAGKKYFIMSLHKEGGGGDSVAVAWQGPGIASRQVIPAKYVDVFYLAPLQAFGPSPANGAVDAAQSLVLSWSAGEKAQKHDVYLGDDKAAVAAADSTSPLFKGTVTDTSFDAGSLEWGKTYYWRVDEINAGEADSPWKGNVWSFTTANFLPVDDMESYNDDDNRIYDSWLDNFGDDSGSTIGNDPAPFAERTIVHGGKQSMPFGYNNGGAKHLFSETVRTFDALQNWTTNGVTDLSLWVRGYPSVTSTTVTETGGKMTLTGSGADIWGATDQFTYAYKTLNGDGTMVARVVSIGPGSNTWAKGGVMIRDSLDGQSTSAQVGLTANSDGTAGNGAFFQNRATYALDMGANDATSNSTAATVIKPPYWVKIERKGNAITGFISANGTTWTQLGVTQNIVMTAPVYIGIFVTAHAAGENRTYEFDNISATGGVSGAWQGAVIDSPSYNEAAPLYVVVEDSTGKSASASNATAVSSAAWAQVKFPLSGFTGVNLAKVKKLYIGVGDRKATAAGGKGKIFVDDIQVTKP